jgi:biotin operon repressor
MSDEAGKDFEVVRTQFGMVPDWADDVITDGTAMRVYVRLSRKYANAKTRECFPSQHALAEELGISAAAVKRAIAHLKECGALFVKRRRQEGGRLGRNIYWLPIDQVGLKYREWLSPDLIPKTPGQLQGSPTDPGAQGSNMSPGPGVKYEPSTNQTQVLTRQKTSSADASGDQIPLLPGLEPLPPEEPAKREPTLNQRAVVLAQKHYERLGKMGHVAAWIKIIRKALEHGYLDAQVDIALQFIADRNWSLTEERLANTLRGGPQPAGRIPPPINGQRKHYQQRPDGRRGMELQVD